MDIEEVSALTKRARFCNECQYFEDRTMIDGYVLCSKGHEPGLICPEFKPLKRAREKELNEKVDAV